MGLGGTVGVVKQVAKMWVMRRTLHIMTKFEVRCECESLSHRLEQHKYMLKLIMGLVAYNITPGLEHHHGDGTSGKSVSNDQLGDDTRNIISDCPDITVKKKPT